MDEEEEKDCCLKAAKKMNEEKDCCLKMGLGGERRWLILG